MSSSDMFWQEHWRKVVGAVVAVAVAILGVGAWSFYQAYVQSSAEALFSEAGDAEGWREVIARYPGSIPAGNAQLRLARDLRQQGDVPAAIGELEDFVRTQGHHPLAGAGWLTLGNLYRSQGREDEAMDAYRTSSTRFPGAYTAGLAMVAEGRLLAASGRRGEARAVFQSVAALHPDTPAAMVAMGEIASLEVPSMAVTEELDIPVSGESEAAD